MKRFTANYTKIIKGYFVIHAETKKEAQDIIDSSSITDNLWFDNITEFDNNLQYSEIGKVKGDD